MLASECLQMIRSIHKEKGTAGLLPQHLPELLLETLANKSEEIEEHERKHLVAGMCSLMVYGELDVDRLCGDDVNISKFPILWTNIVLEDCVRTYRPRGYYPPTLENIFNLERPALKATKARTLSPVKAVEHLLQIEEIPKVAPKASKLKIKKGS